MGLTSMNRKGKPLKVRRTNKSQSASVKKLGPAPHAGFGSVGWGLGPPGVNRLRATEMDPNRIQKAGY